MRGHDSGLRPSGGRLVAQSARAVRGLRCLGASAGDTVLCALDQPLEARRSSSMVGRYGAWFSEAFVLEGRWVRDGCAARGFGSFGRGAGYRASLGVGRRRVQHHRETGEPGPDIPNVAERQRRRELCDRVECRARLLSMPRARRGRQGVLPPPRGRVPVLGEANGHLDPVRFQGDLYERPSARVPHVRSGHLRGGPKRRATRLRPGGPVRSVGSSTNDAHAANRATRAGSRTSSRSSLSWTAPQRSGGASSTAPKAAAHGELLLLAPSSGRDGGPARRTRKGRRQKRRYSWRAPLTEADSAQCARVDSNHHGENSPQGPQPCASTKFRHGRRGGRV